MAKNDQVLLDRPDSEDRADEGRLTQTFLEQVTTNKDFRVLADLLAQLRLTNWKNFRGLDLLLAKRVFIVGPNASGKSNLLDAFRFLRDVADPEGGFQKAVKDRGGVSQIHCLHARKKSQVEVEIEAMIDSDRARRRTTGARPGAGGSREADGGVARRVGWTRSLGRSSCSEGAP